MAEASSKKTQSKRPKKGPLSSPSLGGNFRSAACDPAPRWLAYRELKKIPTELEDRIVLAEIERRKVAAEQKQATPAHPGFPFASIEDLFTSPRGFGVVGATPCQRAICRLIQGVGLAELADHEDVRAMLGHAAPPAKIDELLIIAGIRSGKSMLAAAAGIWCSQAIDLSGLKEGEIPRFAICSVSRDNAVQTHAHLVGALRSEALSPLVVDPKQSGAWEEIIDETGAQTIGAKFLWHPMGRPVEIRVVAGKRAGASIVSRWLVGLVLDEAARMVGRDAGVVNYTDTRRAALGRILDGGMLISPSSPWESGTPVADIVSAEWGRPRGKRLVVRASGPKMNPAWWTPERVEELRHKDPCAHRTDVLAEFLDPEESLYPHSLVAACTRASPLVTPVRRGCEYVAAMDPATRTNAWTFVVATREGQKVVVCLARQWVASAGEKLRPRAVLQEIAETARRYDLSWVYTDQWSADALVDLASEDGVDLQLVVDEWTAVKKTKLYSGFGVLLAEGRVELPPDPVVAADLAGVRRRGAGHAVTIELLKTADGRHCDYAPSIVRAAGRWVPELVEEKPKAGTPEAVALDREKAEDAELDIEFIEREDADHWWDR